MHRRSFFRGAGAAATSAVFSVGLPQSAIGADGVSNVNFKSPRRLRILMLGGTGFLGPTIVKTFLDRGHDMTLFNRGLTNPHLFSYLEKLKGDRENPSGADLEALRGRDWDIVIDTWQKGPKCVEDTAKLLSGHAGAYYYISSLAVYHSSGFNQIGTVESSRLSDLDGHSIIRKPDQVYFLRKTLSEKVLSENFDGSVAIFRSHGLRGARIRTPKSEHYWPARIWRGGDVLVPGDGNSWAQFTDSVSLCQFMSHCAENELSGPFNVMSPSFRLKDYFTAIQNVTHRQPNLIWTSREKLAEFDVEPYRDLPMWRPEPIGFYRFSTDRAVQAGFRHRTLETSVAAMLEGYLERHPQDDFTFGRPGEISASRESEILKALRG